MKGSGLSLRGEQTARPPTSEVGMLPGAPDESVSLRTSDLSGQAESYADLRDPSVHNLLPIDPRLKASPCRLSKTRVRTISPSDCFASIRGGTIFFDDGSSPFMVAGTDSQAFARCS